MDLLVQRYQARPEMLSERINELEDALMQEIWMLWTSPDLTPARLLNWHLVFDSDLMALVAAYLVTQPEHALRRLERAGVGILNPYHPLLDRLLEAYRTALVKRSQDHS
jgi:hypothetical protein